MKENPLQRHNPLGLSGPAKKTQEQLGIKIEIAKENDWKAYRDLRLEAIDSEDADMFGPQIKERDMAKTDLQWQADLSPENKAMFVVLLWSGSEAIGMGVAIKKVEEGGWHLTSGYVKPEFRGGIGKKMFAARLREIIKRHGTKVSLGVRAKNTKSIHIAEGFDAKTDDTFLTKLRKISKLGWLHMEIDLTKPEVLELISNTLDAG